MDFSRLISTFHHHSHLTSGHLMMSISPIPHTFCNPHVVHFVCCTVPLSSKWRHPQTIFRAKVSRGPSWPGTVLVGHMSKCVLGWTMNSTVTFSFDKLSLIPPPSPQRLEFLPSALPYFLCRVSLWYLLHCMLPQQLWAGTPRCSIH